MPSLAVPYCSKKVDTVVRDHELMFKHHQIPTAGLFGKDFCDIHSHPYSTLDKLCSKYQMIFAKRHPPLSEQQEKPTKSRINQDNMCDKVNSGTP